VHIFFLGKRVTCLSAFAPRKRKPCQYYLLLKSIFCWTFTSRTNIEIDPKNTQPNPGYQRLTRSTFSSRIAAWT
jgi:hypothetical protein